MNTLRLTTLALVAFFSAGALRAETAPAAPAAPAYPLTTCVVSGEALDSMGGAHEYIHKEPGKPDRLVKFCCAGCSRSFKKDPAKYLAKLDAAATAPSAR